MTPDADAVFAADGRAIPHVHAIRFQVEATVSHIYCVAVLDQHRSSPFLKNKPIALDVAGPPFLCSEDVHRIGKPKSPECQILSSIDFDDLANCVAAPIKKVGIKIQVAEFGVG
jgi:hypothetical protein